MRFGLPSFQGRDSFCQNVNKWRGNHVKNWAQMREQPQYVMENLDDTAVFFDVCTGYLILKWHL